jgi:nucleoside 2-deoxyribosyltransferase
MRVYIAGPMSGIPLYNFPEFDRVAAEWRALGHDVASPADITRGLYWERFGRQYNPATDRAEWGDEITCELFERDLAAVCQSDALVLLTGWNQSRGARMEITVACALGKAFYSASSSTPLTIEMATSVRSVCPADALPIF